jgi:phosphoserine phosphatase RsbU/P
MPEPMDTPDHETLALRCMEIFGGNRAEQREISVPGVDVLVHARPHNDAPSGGDVHYISTCMRGAITRFMVADVAGHGESVGDLALSLRKLMRKHINTPDQTKLTRQLNKEFAALKTSGRFATAVLATYYSPTHSLIVSNAGHPPPLWYSASRDRWQLLTPQTAGHKALDITDGLENLPLGIIEPTEYHQFAVPLELGDLVVLYTDSLIEAATPSGRQIGSEGLLDLVRTLRCNDSTALCSDLLSGLASYREHAPVNDDETVLVLRHNEGEPHRKSLNEWVGTIGRLMTGS